MLPGLILLLFGEFWWLGLILLAVGLLFASIYRQLIGQPLKWTSKSKTEYKRSILNDTKENAKASVFMLLLATPFIALGLYLLTFSWGKIPGVILLVIGSILAILGWPGFPFE